MFIYKKGDVLKLDVIREGKVAEGIIPISNQEILDSFELIE